MTSDVDPVAVQYGPAIVADPDTGQTELYLPDPNADPQPALHFPNGPRDWMRWVSVLDLSGIGRKPAQETAHLILAELAASVKWSPDDPDYGKAWPSLGTVADRIKRTQRGVRKIMRRLEAAGYVVTIRRKRPDGGDSSNLYALSPSFREGGGEEQNRIGGGNKTPVSFRGGEEQNPSFVPGGGGTKPQFRSPHRTKERTKSPNPAHPRTRGGAFMDSDSPPTATQEARTRTEARKPGSTETQEAKQWLRNRGVRALNLAKVAKDDPEHWNAVRRTVDASGGECGPGMIVQLLRKEADLADVSGVPVYSGPRTCPRCHAFPCDCETYDGKGTDPQSVRDMIRKATA